PSRECWCASDSSSFCSPSSSSSSRKSPCHIRFDPATSAIQNVSWGKRFHALVNSSFFRLLRPQRRLRLGAPEADGVRLGVRGERVALAGPYPRGERSVPCAATDDALLAVLRSGRIGLRRGVVAPLVVPGPLPDVAHDVEQPVARRAHGERSDGRG